MAETFNDWQLADFARCPLYWPGRQPEAILTDAAAKALAWASHQEFLQGHPPTREDLRGVVEKEWRIWIQPNHAKYSWGLSKIRTIAERIDLFLRDHVTIRPVAITPLNLDNGIIYTEYGLWKFRYSKAYINAKGRNKLDSRKDVTTVCPIGTRLIKDEFSRRDPDIREIAVQLAASRENGVFNVSLMTFPMISGQKKVRPPLNWVLAENYLNGILKAYRTDAKYASPGEHCKLCTARPCQELYGTGNGRDDDSQQEGPLSSLLRG